MCAQTINVPPRSGVNVVGRVIRNDLATYDCDWMMIAQKQNDADLVARMLVRNDSRVVIRVLN